MSEHKLKPGTIFIENIKNIGAILGYHVELEYPVTKNTDTISAVDVAWFYEHGTHFPLFIFEIESIASNSMAYNPMKVFAKPNEIFEKPLFLFQILISHGQNSSRVDDLKRAYGTYNYRIYRIAANEGKKLISDIISQHRRLSGDINIVLLIDYLLCSEWIEFDIYDLLKLIQELKFKNWAEDFLPALAVLSLKFSSICHLYCEFLRENYGTQIEYESPPNYLSYIGSNYCIPVHLGIQAIATSDMREKAFCFNKLQAWQTNGGGLSSIGPHFGLSQDYDNFIVTAAGGFFGLLAALFRNIEAARLYFCNELFKIIQATSIQYRSLNFIWLIHIAPNGAKGTVFKKRAWKHFKESGRFSNDIFSNSPFYGSDEIINQLNFGNDPVPEEFDLINIIAPLSTNDFDIMKAAIHSLISNDCERVSSTIIRALHDNA